MAQPVLATDRIDYAQANWSVVLDGNFGAIVQHLVRQPTQLRAAVRQSSLKDQYKNIALADFDPAQYEGHVAYVTDASDDPNVPTSPAIYMAISNGSAWVYLVNGLSVTIE